MAISARAPEAGGRRAPSEKQVLLPASLVGVRLARAHLSALTGGRDDPRAALVVTELVTNAVVHGAGTPELRLRREGPAVRIEVIDEAPGIPTARPLLDVDRPTTDVGGRGLALVDLVADRWGVDHLAGGRKAVWAEVSLSGPPPA